MGYISGDYESKTFTSLSHSIAKIINSTIKSDMEVILFEEYDYDVGLSDVYDKKGLPLSILLMSKKSNIIRIIPLKQTWYITKNTLEVFLSSLSCTDLVVHGRNAKFLGFYTWGLV